MQQVYFDNTPSMDKAVIYVILISAILMLMACFLSSQTKHFNFQHLKNSLSVLTIRKKNSMFEFILVAESILKNGTYFENPFNKNNFKIK